MSVIWPYYLQYEGEWHKRLAIWMLRRYPALARFGLKVRRRAQAPSPPRILRMENTNFCNAECTFCPHPSMERTKGRMDFELYCRVVDQAVAMGIISVQFTGIGEPLLSPTIFDEISYAKNQGIEHTCIISNGELLTETRALKLIQSRLDEICISLDAANKEDFESKRLHLSYDTVVANTKRFLEVRRDLGVPYPKVCVSYIDEGDSEDRSRFIEQWEPLCDEIQIQDLHNWGGDIAHRQGYEYPCRRLWDSITVLWDGRVSICCNDYEGRHIMGDVGQKGLAEIWNNAHYQEMRGKNIEGRCPTLLCSTCDLPKRDNPLWIKPVLLGRKDGFSARERLPVE